MEKQRLESMDNVALEAEKAKHQAWIDSDSNDGRLSAASSADLDYRFDLIEEIDEVLAARA